jgi:hypothetical protein
LIERNNQGHVVHSAIAPTPTEPPDKTDPHPEPGQE